MRLKNIKLAGFKSFVDPTNVQLTSNMVSIVGPNGCGKSNIIDAVRWVMGESSAKNLRGESMADVIFNGSTARKPVGQASIELVFDNSDGTLTGEYAGFTDISIKRKVTRDGQSQYFINGAKCRRRDITDIFLGTGLGPRSYAIIEQGMISRLIESKPDELRVFVEEAAGISKYKERRRETETRIRHTRENLERLTDIRDELERQLQRLQRQASAAKKYKVLKEEEETLKAQTLSLQWQALRDASADQRAAIAQHEIDLEESIAKQRAVDARIEALREEQTGANDNFNTVQGQYYGIGAEVARLEQSVTHHEQRALQLQEDLAETERNASQSAQDLEDDHRKLNDWQAELDQLQPQHEALQQARQESGAALEAAEGAMQGWQQRWDEFNTHAVEPQKNAEVQRSRIGQIEDALSGLAARLQRMQGEIGELDTQPLVDQERASGEQVARCEQQLADLHRQLEAGGERLQQLREEHQQLNTDLDEQRVSLQERRGRLASLQALQQASTDDEQSQQWLRSHALHTAPRLVEALDVQSGWELAVETVLGEALQAVSIDSLDAILGDVEKLDNSNLSFIEAGAGGVASGSVALDPLANFVSGEGAGAMLDGIYAASTLNAAHRARAQLGAGESIVTADGIWLGRNWLRVLRRQDAASGAIARQQDIDTLQRDIDSGQKAIASLDGRRESLAGAISETERERDRLLGEISGQEQQLGASRAESSALLAKIEQLTQRHERTVAEIGMAEHNQLEQREALSAARAQLDEAIASMEQIEEQREQLLLERDQVRDTLAASRETAARDRDAAQAIAVQVEGLRAQINSVTEAIARLEKQLEQLNQRQQTLRENATANSAPIQQLKSQLEEQLAQRVSVEATLSQAREAVEALDQQMRATEQERSTAEQSTQSIRSALEKLRLDGQEMAVRSQTIEEQLVESGHQLEAVIKSLPEEAELESWQNQLAELARRIERLGAINLAAIEEFDTESERKKHLDAQNDELEAALATLETAMQKIDRETRNLFKETFDKLNDSLRDLFPKVFGGGTAYLEMTGEDLLDTGITIMARPPGKRNSTIHLLSGGEKALTAIALVFSIFQLNPAPFCMLDEVDAPLDDANTTRYARMIREMADKVQFIFITHNKITMEMADHLMGVTMHEPGCSRMVSVDIDEAVAMATA